MSRTDVTSPASRRQELPWHHIAAVSPAVWLLVGLLLALWGLKLSRIEGHGAEIVGLVVGLASMLVIQVVAGLTLALSLNAPKGRVLACLALVGHGLLVLASLWAWGVVTKERASDPILLGLLILVSTTGAAAGTAGCLARRKPPEPVDQP